MLYSFRFVEATFTDTHRSQGKYQDLNKWKIFSVVSVSSLILDNDGQNEMQLSSLYSFYQTTIVSITNWDSSGEIRTRRCKEILGGTSQEAARIYIQDVWKDGTGHSFVQSIEDLFRTVQIYHVDFHFVEEQRLFCDIWRQNRNL